jgi:hypothetical protein
MRDYQLMTALSFMQSYDRDVLDLQDDPASFIGGLEAELERCYPLTFILDRNGNRVWPVGILKSHTSIEGEPLWEPSPTL